MLVKDARGWSSTGELWWSAEIYMMVHPMMSSIGKVAVIGGTRGGSGKRDWVVGKLYWRRQLQWVHQLGLDVKVKCPGSEPLISAWMEKSEYYFWVVVITLDGFTIYVCGWVCLYNCVCVCGCELLELCAPNNLIFIQRNKKKSRLLQTVNFVALNYIQNVG